MGMVIEWWLYASHITVIEHVHNHNTYPGHIYKHIYMYIYICIYIYVYMYIYIHIYIYMDPNTVWEGTAKPPNDSQIYPSPTS